MSKFTINKGMSNEFIITIKQNGTTLPMTIVSGTNKYATSFSPKVTYVPYQAHVPAVEARAEVLGQPYIPSSSAIAGKVEIDRITVTAGSAAETHKYTVYIDGVEFTKQYIAATYVNTYGFLKAIATDINNHSTAKLKVLATVDLNTLVLTGVITGQSLLVNVSDNLAVVETQTALVSTPAVVGQVAIPYSAAIPASAEIPEKVAHYVYTGEISTINISNLLATTTTNTKISFSQSVHEVRVNNVLVTPVNGSYDLGSAKVFTVLAKAVDTESVSVPEDVIVNIEAFQGTYSDTFAASLHLLSTGAKVADLPTTIYDTNNGKIKVVVDETLANTLEVAKGDKADLYYSKPMYKLAIDCDTVNNGKFVAKVAKVYVE